MAQQSRITNPREVGQTDTRTDKGDPLVVHVPAELPVLTKQVSRALLTLLIELTEIGVLDGLPTEGRSDVD